MEEFNVVIESLGNTSLSFLASAGVQSIRIFASPADEDARMQICLREDTWEKRARAIHAMVEIREMFMDELSLQYTFSSGEDAAGDVDLSSMREFALA